ncbi:hypothetical protein V5O48_007236 [Marasmius crinis-equi]|uniref:Transcription factor domain-containing protein n=1 Tax=Marasmius crinis-equi TaxID=585013 RepID=A0ABR3FHB4_9AGAR
MLASPHPKRVIHAIQAEVLLANYFFHTQRMLEGKYRLNTALSLIAGAGLHRIRSANSSRPSALLPIPVDSVEEGEMINAFWTVYSMHNVWDSIQPGSGPVVFDRDGQRVDVPWPLDMTDYEQDENGTTPLPSGYSTVRNFLSSVPTVSGRGTSLMAMYSKASILFCRATSLAGSSRTIDMNGSARESFIASFDDLDGLIDSFTGELPPLHRHSSNTGIHLAILTHTLTYTSTIQLHSTFSRSDVRSHRKSLAAARAAVDLVSSIPEIEDDPRSPNPIMAVLWGIIGHVLADELRRLRANPRSAPAERRKDLAGMLEGLLAAMEAFGGFSALMAYEAEQLRALLSN